MLIITLIQTGLTIISTGIKIIILLLSGRLTTAAVIQVQEEDQEQAEAAPVPGLNLQHTNRLLYLIIYKIIQGCV